MRCARPAGGPSGCLRAGQVELKLKTPWRDGTTHLVMSPLEFMQRLAALVPRSRLHLIRFYGVLAPNAKVRALVVPKGRAHADTARLDRFEFAGELSLSGELQPVRGAIALALGLRKLGTERGFVLPQQSAEDSAWGVTVYGARHLLDVVRWLAPNSAESPTLQSRTRRGKRQAPRPTQTCPT